MVGFAVDGVLLGEQEAFDVCVYTYGAVEEIEDLVRKR